MESEEKDISSKKKSSPQQQQPPPPSQPQKSSNTGLILLTIFVIIAIFLAFIACCGVSSTGTEIDTINTDLDKVETDLKALDTQVQTMNTSINTLSTKTTDLSYVNNTSTFTNNLNVAGTLTAGNEDINQTLSTMTTSGTTVTFSGDVIVKDKNIYNEIVALNQGAVNVKDLTLETLNATKTVTTVDLNVNGKALVNSENVGQLFFTAVNYNTLSSIASNSAGTKGSILTGTGPGASFDSFDLSVYSNGGIGFVNSSAQCKTVLDVNNGIVKSHTIDLLRNAMFKNSCAGYMLTTKDNYTVITATYSILMSMRFLDPQDKDDIWIINPGYRFVLYAGTNYSGINTDNIDPSLEPRLSLDNTFGYNTNYIKLTNTAGSVWGPRDTSSIKVYYKGVEIAPIPGGPGSTGNPSNSAIS